MNGRLALVGAWISLLFFDTASQLAFKIGSASLVEASGARWLMAALESPWIVGGVAGYVGSFLSWMQILRRLDLSFAFPMTALGYVVVLGASQVFLGETVNFQRWIGVGCIVAGFLLMLGDRSSRD